MLNLNKLPILNDNHEYLIDNEDYSKITSSSTHTQLTS